MEHCYSIPPKDKVGRTEYHFLSRGNATRSKDEREVNLITRPPRVCSSKQYRANDHSFILVWRLFLLEVTTITCLGWMAAVLMPTSP